MRKTTAEPARTPVQVKAAAISRVLERRRAAKFATYADPHAEGKVRVQLDGGPGDIAEPTSIAEWADDRLSRCCPGTPATDVLTEMFEMIRTKGADAVPAAIRLAESLDTHGQFGVFMVLNSTPGGGGGIETVRTRLLREWRSRRLQDQPPPAAPFGPDPMDLDTPRPGRIEYRSALGHPAGLPCK
jgi:hypothetical protein